MCVRVCVCVCVNYSNIQVWSGQGLHDARAQTQTQNKLQYLQTRTAPLEKSPGLGTRAGHILAWQRFRNSFGLRPESEAQDQDLGWSVTYSPPQWTYIREIRILYISIEKWERITDILGVNLTSSFGRSLAVSLQDHLNSEWLGCEAKIARVFLRVAATTVAATASNMDRYLNNLHNLRSANGFEEMSLSDGLSMRSDFWLTLRKLGSWIDFGAHVLYFCCSEIDFAWKRSVELCQQV